MGKTASLSALVLPPKEPGWRSVGLEKARSRSLEKKPRLRLPSCAFSCSMSGWEEAVLSRGAAMESSVVLSRGSSAGTTVARWRGASTGAVTARFAMISASSVKGRSLVATVAPSMSIDFVALVDAFSAGKSVGWVSTGETAATTGDSICSVVAISLFPVLRVEICPLLCLFSLFLTRVSSSSDEDSLLVSRLVR